MRSVGSRPESLRSPGNPRFRVRQGTRHQAGVLLDGLDILRLEETERDGHAFSGPKHWHTFDILARRRISKPQRRRRPADSILASYTSLVSCMYCPRHERAFSVQDCDA